MNKRNCKMRHHFWNAKEYSSNKENRQVLVFNEGNNAVEVCAILFCTVIARRNLISNTLEIRAGHWPTRTTANAVRAVLPPGWTLSCWTLINKDGGCIAVKPGNEWTLVEKPLETYAKSWG